MIAQLRGEVSEKQLDHVIVDCAGVGYGVYVTAEDYEALGLGEVIKLYIYEHIRENMHDLFGFLNVDAKRFFELLLTVNGVGPKMAMNIMTVGSLSSVRAAIAAGDTKYISQASGVGKRVAERVVVDLKDKVGLVASSDATDFLAEPSVQDEAVQGLMALGFSAQDAALALQKVDKTLSTEDRIKLALRQ